MSLIKNSFISSLQQKITLQNNSHIATIFEINVIIFEEDYIFRLYGYISFLSVAIGYDFNKFFE